VDLDSTPHYANFNFLTPEEAKQFGRARSRWEDIIKIGINKFGRRDSSGSR
jgi:hypothetical protein